MAKKKKPAAKSTKTPKAKPAKAKVTKKAPAKKAAVPKKAAIKKAPAKKAAAPKKAAGKVVKANLDTKKESKKVAKVPVAKEPKAKVEKPIKENIAKKEAKKSKKAVETVTEDVSADAAEALRPAERDVFLTDAEGRRLCKVKDCDQLAAVESYCRYHYLLFWKKIQNRKKILSEGKLEQYIEELTSRYPVKFLELIRKDLHTEADFMSAIQELDIDENSTMDEFEEDENFMDEVRGIGTETDRSDDEY